MNMDIILGIIIMWIASRIHNNVAIFGVISAIVFIPYFIYQYMPVLVRDISLCSAFGVYEIFHNHHTMLGIQMVYLSIIVYCIIMAVIIYDGVQFYEKN